MFIYFFLKVSWYNIFPFFESLYQIYFYFKVKGIFFFLIFFIRTAQIPFFLFFTELYIYILYNTMDEGIDKTLSFFLKFFRIYSSFLSFFTTKKIYVWIFLYILKNESLFAWYSYSNCTQYYLKKKNMWNIKKILEYFFFVFNNYHVIIKKKSRRSKKIL